MVKVSVIVPVYNVEEYLAWCLDTVVAQTFEDIEIICVNDGSTDRSCDILEHYKNFDSRIKIINKKNGGLSSARNEGIEAAVGKYILFLDSDDWLSSTAVEHLYNDAEKNDSDVVVFDFIWDDCLKKTKTIMTNKEYYDGSTFNIDTIDLFMYKHFPPAAWSRMYRTSLIKENDIRFFEDMIYEDLPFWAEVFVKSKKITYIPELLYSYRALREGSLMAKRGRVVFDIIKAYDRVENIFKSSGYWEKYKPVIQLLMIRDFLHRYDIIEPELREEYFNALKSLNKNVGMVLYENGPFSRVEKAGVDRFKLLNEVDYKSFCEADLR